jgi:aspartyl protease family protein
MDKLFLYIVVIGIAIGVAMPGSRPGSSGNPHRVTTPSEPAKETQLERTESGHFYTYATVNGQLVKFIVDTGADVVALTPEDAERAGGKFNPADFDVVGEGAGGPIRGQPVMIDSIEIDGKLVNDVRGVVIENASRSLLGQSYLERMGEVQMRGSTMVLR